MKKTAKAVFFICAGVGGTIRQGCTGKDASPMTSLARGIMLFDKTSQFFIKIREH